MSGATEAALESRVARLERAFCLAKEERDAAVREKEKTAREKDAVIEALAARLSKLEAAAGGGAGHDSPPGGSAPPRKRTK